MTKTIETQRDEILLAVLPNILFDGWSKSALETGLADADISLSQCGRIFPGGILELAAHFSDYADRQMLIKLNEMDLSSLPIRERIIVGVRLRLEVVAPYREAIRRLLTFLSLPQNHLTGIRCSLATVDAIWYAAGDKSTDFNYYTKRGLLMGVYSGTVLYWLADESEGFEETWGFLERRINNVLALPKMGGKVSDRIKKSLGIMPRLGRRFLKPI